MSFGSPSNNRLGILGSLCSSGGVGSQTILRAGCANSGSATNVRLWDSFKASGTIDLSPATGTSESGENFDIKIVPPTVGTFWDSRIGSNANNYNDGFNFSCARLVTGNNGVGVDSVSYPRGDTARYVFDFGGENIPSPKIRVTGIINDTAGAGGTTYNVGDWCGGDSNSDYCDVTISELEGFDCLHESILVNTDEGLKHIDTLSIGDRALSYNFKNNEIESVQILKILKPEHKGLYKVKFDNDVEIILTKPHPIISEDGKLFSISPELALKMYDLKCDELKIDTSIKTIEGSSKVISMEKIPDTHKTYTINTINRNFYASNFLVHSEMKLEFNKQ